MTGLDNPTSPTKVAILNCKSSDEVAREIILFSQPAVNSGELDIYILTDIPPGIKPSGETRETIFQNRLEAAEVLVLLVSISDLAAFGGREDKLIALAYRQAKDLQNKGTVIVPVLVTDCLWKLERIIEETQLLPIGQKNRPLPITNWSNKSEAYQKVVEGVLLVARRVRAGKA